MQILEKAGMLTPLKQRGFQHKNGAVFARGERRKTFDFRDKFSSGPATTWQVQRAEFDKILADDAESAGVEVCYEEEIRSVDVESDFPELESTNLATGENHRYRGRFLLDASGFGRVLPRLLALDLPSSFPVRQSLFTHIEDNISDPDYDRNKIRIGVHPIDADVWVWLIPFSNGRCSVGVVAEESYLSRFDRDNEGRLRAILDESRDLRALLCDAVFDMPVNEITGYSSNVTSLCGNNYLLLGNAGEFLDPIFSSGVTIALKSAELAADLLHRHFQGDQIDWVEDYARTLQKGVDVFKTYVEAWYDGRFQDIVFYENPRPEIQSMICSILAGYAWDEENPYVAKCSRRLNALARICAS
jgi:flavin-dependent dehydrogenase